jgi:double-stranded uracil-DNA glycosylase
VIRHACFPPVVNDQTRTLILGSLPGAASLAAGRYYANPRNQFWRLLGAVIRTDLESLPYQERLDALLAREIGLWDVIADAERAGSLDAAIRNHAANNLRELARSLPNLHTIAFNGGMSARIGTRQLGILGERFRLLRLPSSSPAYTLAFEAKREAWLKLGAPYSHP